MPQLARAGFTDDEVRQALEADDVQMSVRVELQTQAGTPVRNLRNITGGKVTHDVDRDIRRTLQLAMSFPAGIGDDFDRVDSIADYDRYDGAVAGQWLMNPRFNDGELTATGQSSLIYRRLAHDDMVAECDCSRAEQAGLVVRFVNKSNYYLLQFCDASSGVAANTMTLYRVVGGVQTQLATCNISFMRAMSKRIRLEVYNETDNGTVLRAYFNNLMMMSTADASLLNLRTGRAGLWANSGANVFQKLAVRAFDSIDYNRQRFAPFFQLRMPVLLNRTENSVTQFNAGTRVNATVSSGTVIISAGQLTGTYTSPNLSLTGIGVPSETMVAWIADTPAGGDVIIDTSIDNGVTWQRAVNGGLIPSLRPGRNLNGTTLKVRATMTRTGTGVVVVLRSLQVRLLSGSESGAWVEFPLGKFIMPTPKADTADGVVLRKQVDGYDLSYPLTDEITERLFFPAGTLYTDAIAAVLSMAKVTADVSGSDAIIPGGTGTTSTGAPVTRGLVILGLPSKNIQPAETPLPVGVEFTPKKRLFDALKFLCAAINYDFFVDELGVMNVIKMRDTQASAPNWIYKTNSRSLVRAVTSQSLDVFDVPNHVYLSATNADTREVINAEVFNDNPESPVSTYSRGYNKTFSDYNANAPDYDTLMAQARQVLFDKSQVIEAVGTETICNPAHGHRDKITYVNDAMGLRADYDEQAWEISFDVADGMRHDVQRIMPI